MTFNLIPNWQKAYRLHSVQVAAAISFLGVVRETAQKLVDTVPQLEWVAHAPWFAPSIAILGAVAGLARVKKQPDDVLTADPPKPSSLVPLFPAPPATVPAVPEGFDMSQFGSMLETLFSTQGKPMNKNFSALFNFALKSIIGMQQISAAQPTPLTGPEKKAAVIAIAQASVDPADTSTVGTILNLIDPIVESLKFGHSLFQKPGASTITQAFPPPVN